MTLKPDYVPAHGALQTSWHARTAKSHHPLAALIAGLALLAILTPLNGSWAVQVLLVPLLLTIPGVILLRAMRVPGTAIASHPVYVPSASLILLAVSGLAVNLVGPLLGLTEPLRPAPLLIGLELVCLALLACSMSAPPETQIPWSSLSRPIKLAWPLLLPLVSAAGALRLNSGHSNPVAVIAVIASIILLAAAFLLAPRLDEALLVVIIYATALAMIWSFSLRGDTVYGFDIASEYYSLHQTVVTGIWHLSHPNDAYGAMLSVTVLPAELHALSGIPDLLIFKVVYPAIGALFPVVIYSLGRHVLTRRWAFMAAALVVMQETFFQEFPALAREEIATLLFAALISAVLDRSLPRRTQYTLVCLLSLVMVVSHYSTTYLAILLLGIAMVIQWAVSWFRPVPRVTGALVLACIVSLFGAFLWYGPLTHSTSNVSQFVVAVKDDGVNLLPNRGGSLISTYLQGEQQQELTPSQYERHISEYYKSDEKFVTSLPGATEPQYALQAAANSTPIATSTADSTILNLVGLLIQQFTNLLAGIGAFILALRRKASLTVRQIGLLGLAGIIILTLTRISGTIAQEYNPERALLQTMVVLAISVCWVLAESSAKWKRIHPVILTVCAASLAIFLAESSGLTNFALGAGTATNLANSFDDYQEFYMTTQEIASASWVTEEAPPGQLIYADRYGQLRLDIVAGDRTGVLGDITPQTLDQQAWVYASRPNTVDNITRSNGPGYDAIYAFPKRFLDSNFDTVYTNGTSEVFHR